MPKQTLFVLSLFVIIATATATIVFNNLGDKLSKAEIETASNQASFFYKQKLERKDSLESGPCISDALMDGWVADIVHSPRTHEDDLPENQCPSYVQGRAKHIVELDTEGRVVKVK